MLNSCSLARELSALDEMFAFLKARLPEGSADEDAVFCVNLAAEELFTNLIRHNVGRGDEILLELEVSEPRIFIRFTDYDVEPFDPKSVPAVKLDAPLAQRNPGGLGMHLVRSVVDRVTYEYQDRAMRVSAEKQRRR
ncbi:MAG: serine/threonine-protein kinase RsbW [Acidobacteriota bacterium]|nr:serine/threonine-protein kinase RsbW [Acidobacteriota bacterium]